MAATRKATCSRDCSATSVASQAGLSNTIGQGIFQAVSLVVSAVIMLTVNIPLGLVVLAGAPIVAVVYKSMAKGATTRSLTVQEDNAALFGAAAENYQANPVVKMFGLADHERGRFRRSSDRLFASQRRLSLYGGLFGLSVNMIVTILRLIVLGLGAWLIIEGDFTLGGLVAFLSIMGEVLSPVTVLTTLGQDIQASMGSLTRINEVLEADLEPEGADLGELPPLQNEIRIADLGFSYTQERRVLDGIDVVIEAGTKVAFVGPSGSGKSTVLKMLMRMYEPDEGAVLLDGVDVRQRSLASLRDQVGVVFQDPFLFDTTLRENIALGRQGATDDEIRTAAEAAEIDAFLDTLPRGFDTLVGERGSNLSGGQRQRVSIARPLFATRVSCCSTRRPRRSTPRPNARSARRSIASARPHRRVDHPPPDLGRRLRHRRSCGADQVETPRTPTVSGQDGVVGHGRQRPRGRFARGGGSAQSDLHLELTRHVDTPNLRRAGPALTLGRRLVSSPSSLRRSRPRSRPSETHRARQTA